ncbi:hypothetical protein QQP08_021009 [Theobroma cacao]|nr:hypothetical protein QQP08_021009 [Theobroma cacao]
MYHASPARRAAAVMPGRVAGSCPYISFILSGIEAATIQILVVGFHFPLKVARTDNVISLQTCLWGQKAHGNLGPGVFGG